MAKGNRTHALPKRTRERIVRLKRQGRTYKQIAAECGCAECTAQHIVAQSREHLKFPIVGYPQSAKVKPCPECGKPSRLPRGGLPCVACQVRAYQRKRKKEPTP